MRLMQHALVLAIGGSAAAAATAQSSVQIWGIIDQGVVKMNDGSSIGAFPGAGGRNGTDLKHAWQPRLGFRGVEDLGGGLQAFFDLEHRFNVDDGASAVPFWFGRSAVGLRHAAWGEVRLGREYNPAFYPAVVFDPFSWNTVGQMGLAYTWARYNANDGGPRNNNQIQYKTPDFGGVTALLAVALNDAPSTRGRAKGGNLIYSKGPVYLGFAFDQAENLSSTGRDARLVMLGGAYDFGFVRPRISFAKSRNFAGLEVKSTVMGATAPVGPGRVVVGVARANPEGNNNDSTKYGLGYHYDLSKRTMLYVDMGSAKTDNQTRSTGFDVGMRHTF